MNDVGHELGAIRHIVDSPLSSKVAMFNKVANQHNASQLLNPFSNVNGGRASPKPSFSKDEYGKPLAGSLTEMRGQKANIHVCKEMLELCQIIDSEGFCDERDPDMRIIFFGDLFNIYNYISDKVVGLLLRARKHKLVDFEGEMLFQRRDDEVPIFLIKPIKEIREILEAKQEGFRRSVSPAPQATTVLQEKMKTNSSPNLLFKSGSPSRSTESNTNQPDVYNSLTKPPLAPVSAIKLVQPAVALDEIVKNSAHRVTINIADAQTEETTTEVDDEINPDQKIVENQNNVEKKSDFQIESLKLENETADHATASISELVSTEHDEIKIIKENTSMIELTPAESKSSNVLSFSSAGNSSDHESNLDQSDINETKTEPILSVMEIDENRKGPESLTELVQTITPQ